MFWLFCLLASLQSHYLVSDTSHLVENNWSSSSKAKAFARSAELEFSKMNDAALKAGIALCLQACNDASFRRLQIDERLWIYKMLSTAHQRSHAYEKQEELIFGLLDDVQFSPYWVSLKVHLGLSYLAQDRCEDAEKLLKSLMSKSMRKLAFQDSEEIARLYSRIQQYYDKKLASAEQKFQDKDFCSAALDFASVHDAALRASYPQTLSPQSYQDFLSHLGFRLSQSLFLDGRFDEAIQIASKQEHPLLIYQATLLQGYAYKKKGLFDLALNKFANYASAPGVLAFSREALWEASFCAMKTGNLGLAKEYFQELQKEPMDGQLFRRKKALQILICIEDGKFQEANLLISQYEKTFMDSRQIPKLECQYLKGYLFFKQRQFDRAALHLEQSLPDAQTEACEWKADAHYLLGLSYLELAKRSQISMQQHLFFERAESSFEKIYTLDAWRERSALCLASSFFHQQDLPRLSDLIKKNESLVSPDCLYEMKLLLARQTFNFDEVLQVRYQDYNLYPRALLTAPHNGETLAQAFALVVQRKQQDADFALISEIIQALQSQNQPIRGLKLLDSLIPALRRKENIEEARYLYLRCFFDCIKEQGALSQEAILLYDQFLTDFPNSRFMAEVLHLKALTYWLQNDKEKSKEIYTILAKDYPNSKLRDEVLFFLATLSDEPATLYLELFTTFPESRFASEAYFRYYPESAYKQQDIHAIAHLKKMPPEMQQSIYGVFGSIYVAQAIRQECPEKSLSNAQLKLLQEAISRFDQAIDAGEKIIDALAPKLARFCKIRLLEASLDRAEALFILANAGTRSQSSFDELKDRLDALQANIKNNLETDRPHLLLIWQEAALQKSRAYLLQGEEKQAREELTNLIEYMKQEEFEQGDALVRALCQLAQYYTREGSIDAADATLNKAQVVQARGASQERLLEIYITKSGLHRKKEEFDRAMILLSSVINDTSASSLRVQAMFLRAELYELKGRRDLAMRQLQATAKKGGEWGNRAKKKLEEQYGYE